MSESLLRDLQARLDITGLIHAYCLHFDRNEPEHIAALFTADASVDYGPEFPRITGREAIYDGVRQGLAERFAATSHHVSKIDIHFNSAQAASRLCYLYAWHSYQGSGEESELWAQYHHRFVLTAQGWRISELVLKAAGSRNFHRERMHPIGRK